MWQTVELRELRVFLVLAEELHFGRTAEALQLTPSRVSQTLRELEQKLGGQLVHRTSRRVRLTPFGERFLNELRPAYEQLTEVLERTSAATSSMEGTLRLGLYSDLARGPRLIEIVHAFEALHPECTVELVQVPWDDPFGRLREGEVELIATWVPLEQPDLVIGPTLTREPRAVAVGRDHPLAARSSVSIEELAEHPVMRFESWPKDLSEAVLPFETPRGKQIPGKRTRVGERATLDTSMLIARGDVVFPTVPSAKPYMGGPDLVFVPLTGLPKLRSALAWRRPARDPKLRAFIGVAREALRG